MVFYRKYRPQTIYELDSTTVRYTLSAVLSGDVPHAFLFTGPKGLGKTSAARIVAKVVNCEKKLKVKDRSRKSSQLGIEPCNTCEMCISIINGTNMDVLEIDAASNRGIDEIRSLRETIKLAPFQARKKVYIIDEVHMLTTEAFNALLKTLEEPPSHAIFILCTTEPHKLPATIVSRCLHISFLQASDDELIRSFRRVAQGEGLIVDDETLLAIAKLSDGGFRDGVKILEELTAFSDGKKITKELLEAKYQIANIAHQIAEMIRFLISRDVKGGIQLVGKLVEQGVDIKYFVSELLQELHMILLDKVGVTTNSKFNPPAGGQSSKLTVEELKQLFELFSKAHQEIKFAVIPQLPLELAIVEWTIVRKLKVDPPAGGGELTINKLNEKEDFKDSSSRQRRVQNGSPSDFWQQFIEKTKSYNHSLAGVLRSCKIKQHDTKRFVIQTPYAFHKQKLEEKKAQELLEKVYQEVTGKKGSVVIELKEKGVIGNV